MLDFQTIEPTADHRIAMIEALIIGGMGDCKSMSEIAAEIAALLQDDESLSQG